MGEEFHTSKPIYLQIIEKIHRKIVRNELKLGEKLPSVREMAVQMGVNPNTIQRTYSELERVGIVQTKRGQGTFVTENVEVINGLKEKLQEEIIEAFVTNMEELGFSKEDMITGINMYFNKKE